MLALKNILDGPSPQRGDVEKAEDRWKIFGRI
jgi:hypothetical protein